MWAASSWPAAYILGHPTTSILRTKKRSCGRHVGRRTPEMYRIRFALEARGLSTDGSKKELKARLLAAITTSMDEGDEDLVPEVPGTTI